MEDWQMGKSLIEANTYLINNQFLSDISFVFPLEALESDLIYSHTWMLSKRSMVFYTMFHGSLQESKHVIILDASKADFLVFLKYIYVDIADLTTDNVVEISYLAKKYFITTLTESCLIYTIKHLNELNLFSLLERSIDSCSRSIEKLCLEFISENTLKTLTSESFINQAEFVVKHILEELEKADCEEMIIFQQVLKWADNYCLKKNVERSSLQDVFQQIRYSSMNGTEFSECAQYSDLFESNLEIGQILVGITRPKELQVEGEPSLKKQKTSGLKLRSKREMIYKKHGFFILLNEKINQHDLPMQCRVRVLALKNLFMVGFDLMGNATSAVDCAVLDNSNREISKVDNLVFKKRIYMEQNRIYSFVFNGRYTSCYQNIKLGKIFQNKNLDIFLVVSAENNVIKRFFVEA